MRTRKLTIRSVSSLLLLTIFVTVVAVSAFAVNVRDHRDPSTSGGAYTLSANPVFELTLTLKAGQSTTCETRNLTPRADPILHLLAPSTTNGAVTEVARDDDSAGNLNARFTYRATRAGQYRLIMHATSNSGIGTADIYCDNKPVWLKLPVGGAFKRLQTLRPKEVLMTVPLPGGPLGHLVYLFDEQQKMLARYKSGPNDSVMTTISATTAVRNLMVGSVWPDITGPLRLIRNDYAISGHDPDKDFLGTELEKQIGTCSTSRDIVGNWECSRTVDMRDTDGDGISDYEELVGRITSAPYQLLPRWGADPRHKDLFIEVDSMARNHHDPPHVMDPKVALKMAGLYGDADTTDPLFKLAHAQALNNPDLQNGIRLHLDTGVNPPDSAPLMDKTTYGDWHGHDVAAAVCSGSDDSTCHGADGPSVWRSMMNKNRYGIFHYALGYPGGGGQAPFHSVALNMPLDDAPTASHELGHTLGLDHNGPVHSGTDANCKPNYPSLMSYAYLGSTGFSDGYGRAVVNNVALHEVGAVPQPTSGPGATYLGQLRDNFRFNVDTTTGNVDWNRDGVFTDGVTRAYANDNGDCEFTRINAMPTAGISQAAPALTRIENKTIIFYVDERSNKLAFDYTTDDLSCPGIEGRCGQPLKHVDISGSWNQQIRAVDAHPMKVGGVPKILLVYRNDSGLFETTMTTDLNFSNPVAIRTASPAQDEFSLAGHDDVTILMYKNHLGLPIMKVRSSSNGTWDGDEPVRDATSIQIGPLAPSSSPGLLEATVNGGTRTLFAVLPMTDQGVLNLYQQDPTNGTWKPTPWQTTAHSIGRPAISMDPVGAGSPMPGRIRILYLQRGSTDNHLVQEAILRANGIGPNATIAFATENFDNDWYYGKGVDLLFDPNVDTNVRAAVDVALVVKDVPQPHKIELRPKADGIIDFNQKNWNDWEGLGVDLCRDLASGGASVKCPAWPFP